jgi:catecholate siderophore receptor
MSEVKFDNRKAITVAEKVFIKASKKEPVGALDFLEVGRSRSPLRSPLTHAGLASIILVTGAAAQDAPASSPAPSATSTTQPSEPTPPAAEPARTAQETSTTLPQIDVRARRRAPAPAAPAPAPPSPEATIPDSASGPYQTTSSGLNRVPTRLIDTPQTVNVVPQVVIQQQVASDVRDALRNVAGVTFRAGEGGNQGDTPYIRGFSAQNDIFRDGIRDPGWYTRDTFPIDAVEVYKGPSSVLFGRGSTGGAINLISKLPQDRNFNEATITGNTGPGVRGTLDVNRKIDDKIDTRVILMGQRYDIPDRDHVEVNRWGIAPSVKVKIDNLTTNTLSYIYQHDNNIPDYGVPFLNIAFGNPRPIAPVVRNTWYGILGPNPDVEKLDAHILTNKFAHEFNADLKLINTTRYTYVDHFQRNVFPEPPPVSLTAPWTPNRNQVGTTNTLVTNATDVIAKFYTGGLEHNTVSGVEITRETRDFQRYTYAGQGSVNLFAPDPYRFGGNLQSAVPSGLTHGESTDVAAYIADQIKLNKYFELLGSIRVEQFRFTQNAPLETAGLPLSIPPLANIGRTDNLVSWRVGAVFHPTSNSSLYVMHGTSFNPSADNLSISLTSLAGAMSLTQIAPEKNVTTEAGVKAEVLNQKLSLASAVFHTEKTNLRVPDPSNNSVTVLNGSIEANGFEASATGYLTDQWQIIASYTYVHARVTKTSIALALNAEPQNTPTNAFSLWTTYDVTKKFQVGFGAFFNDQVYGDLPNSNLAGTVQQSALVPAWWRFDAMAAYKLTDRSTLQLNVYNLTDKFYYQSAYTNWAVPAPGRSAALTLRVRW